MNIDKKKLYITSAIFFALLFLFWFLPNGSGRILAAILLSLGGIFGTLLFPKKSIYSINKKQILLIMAVSGVLYVTLYYVTGLWFDYYLKYPRLSIGGFFGNILPVAAIVVGSELCRKILLAQKDKAAGVFSYLICVLSEGLIATSVLGVQNFNQFMDLIGLTLMPAVIANALYHYLAKRYGAQPNIAFRLITSLFLYIFSYASGLPNSLYAFARLVIPILLFWFIDALYERKRQYALKRKSKWTAVGIAALAIFLTGYVMLISCKFSVGMLVIGSESMTGELNKGDAVVYTAYEEQVLTEGQVLIFQKDKARVVHRIVDVQRVNGVTRYYTKGDANEEWDAGFITEEQIIGIASFKIPIVGYPTLWLRSLFV